MQTSAIVLLLHLCLCDALSAPALTAQWRVAHIGAAPQQPEIPVAEAFVEGDSVIVVSDMVSAAECKALAASASATASAYRSSRQSTGLDNDGLVRVPTIDAKSRADENGTPCADPLDADGDALVQELLTRVMAFVDSELPTVASALFGGAIGPLRASESLEFSHREPTVNVYGPGGECT